MEDFGRFWKVLEGYPPPFFGGAMDGERNGKPKGPKPPVGEPGKMAGLGRFCHVVAGTPLPSLGVCGTGNEAARKIDDF